MLLSQNFYRQAAFELSRISRYYDRTTQVDHEFGDNETLFGLVESPSKKRVQNIKEISEVLDAHERNLLILNATLNYSLDIEGLLQSLKDRINRSTRVAVIAYNPYYRNIFRFFSTLRLIRSRPISTFITQDSLHNLALLTGFELVRTRAVGIFPFSLFGLGDAVSRFFCAIPLVRWFAPASILVLRPIIAENTAPSLSIVIPARNEEGNVKGFLSRLPSFGDAKIEVVMVEGNSTDQTWNAIQNLVKSYSGPYSLKAIKQTAKGKNNAVREGFDIAMGDLLTILDADLTMPPEMLGRFYQAYLKGHADFINGSRLVYPMEGEAMRFLNKLGNVFFVKALNFSLENSISDSLCGTKMIRRSDYIRLKKWRKDFGDFDPFGDFELLFFASQAALGIVDIPIYYRARTYGETNIRRFRDGWILLKMTFIALTKIRI